MFPTSEGLQALKYVFNQCPVKKNPSLQVPYCYYHLLVVCFVKNICFDRDYVIMYMISSASREGLYPKHCKLNSKEAWKRYAAL